MPRTTEFCCFFFPVTNTQTAKLDSPPQLLLVYIGGSHGDELGKLQTLRKSNWTHINTQSLGQHGFYST
jgi:hypothetical protein